MGRDRARPRNRKQQVVLRKDLMRLFNKSCVLCGEYITCRLTVEHLVPITRGGSDKKENLAPAHWVCNYVRGNSSFVWAALRLEQIHKAMGNQAFCKWVHTVPYPEARRLPEPATPC